MAAVQTAYADPRSPMEFPLQMVMAAKRLRPVARSAQHSPGLSR